jgi:hypothetical protein
MPGRTFENPQQELRAQAADYLNILTGTPWSWLDGLSSIIPHNEPQEWAVERIQGKIPSLAFTKSNSNRKTACYTVTHLTQDIVDHLRILSQERSDFDRIAKIILRGDSVTSLTVPDLQRMEALKSTSLFYQERDFFQRYGNSLRQESDRRSGAGQTPAPVLHNTAAASVANPQPARL